jgi:hypothetical protein
MIRYCVTPHPQKVYGEHTIWAVRPPVFNLDEVLDDGECDSLYVDELLDFVPYEQAQAVLQGFARKVALGGELILSGVNLRKATRHHGELSLTDEAFQVITRGRPGAVSLQRAVQLLQGLGFRLTTQLIDIGNYIYLVKGVRS